MCIWECTIDPEDLMPVEEPPTKRDKKTDSDEEDDVNIEKTIEKTDKQAKAYEDSLLKKSRNFLLIILYHRYYGIKNNIRYVI